jgi:hypothetical protein
MIIGKQGNFVFAIGDVVRFRRQDWTALQTLSILELLENYNLGTGEYTVVKVKKNPAGCDGPDNHRQILKLVHKKTNEPFCKKGWTGWWFEKVS